MRTDGRTDKTDMTKLSHFAILRKRLKPITALKEILYCLTTICHTSHSRFCTCPFRGIFRIETGSVSRVKLSSYLFVHFIYIFCNQHGKTLPLEYFFFQCITSPVYRRTVL